VKKAVGRIAVTDCFKLEVFNIYICCSITLT